MRLVRTTETSIKNNSAQPKRKVRATLTVEFSSKDTPPPAYLVLFIKYGEGCWKGTKQCLRDRRALVLEVPSEMLNFVIFFFFFKLALAPTEAP